MLRAIGNGAPFDWRILVNGYLPDYAYARGAVATDIPLEILRDLAPIAPRAIPAGLGPDFSEAIRQGVPRPAP